MKKSTVFIWIGIAGAIAASMVFRGHTADEMGVSHMSKLPDFTADQLKGEVLFDANCEACHGKYAAGSKIGPTLIHKIYEPSHHSDGSFYLAAKNGVRQHHWQLGNMPPIATVTPKDVAFILSYVRAIQRANGIN